MRFSVTQGHDNTGFPTAQEGAFVASWERAADLGERLREVRVGLGLTQAAFGELLGVTDQTVSDWEGGRSRPTKTKLERLARKVGFPVSVFMEGGPRPATLPRRPVERRTGPTSTLEALAARLAFLRDSIRA